MFVRGPDGQIRCVPQIVRIAAVFLYVHRFGDGGS